MVLLSHFCNISNIINYQVCLRVMGIPSIINLSLNSYVFFPNLNDRVKNIFITLSNIALLYICSFRLSFFT